MGKTFLSHHIQIDRFLLLLSLGHSMRKSSQRPRYPWWHELLCNILLNKSKHGPLKMHVQMGSTFYHTALLMAASCYFWHWVIKGSPLKFMLGTVMSTVIQTNASQKKNQLIKSTDKNKNEFSNPLLVVKLSTVVGNVT